MPRHASYVRLAGSAPASEPPAAVKTEAVEVAEHEPHHRGAVGGAARVKPSQWPPRCAAVAAPCFHCRRRRHRGRDAGVALARRLSTTLAAARVASPARAARLWDEVAQAGHVRAPGRARRPIAGHGGQPPARDQRPFAQITTYATKSRLPYGPQAG